MWALAKSKRVWVASFGASAYATIPFVLFPVYFVLIILAIKLARQRGICYYDAPLYGAHLALRVLSAIALAGALRFDFSHVLNGCEATAIFATQTREALDPCLQANTDPTNLVLNGCEATAILAIQTRHAFDPCMQVNADLTNLVRILVCCCLIWIWIKHNRRPPTVTQLGSAAIVAFAALLVNAALTPTPGSISVGWPTWLVWDRLGLTSIYFSYAEITLQVLLVAGLGCVLGHLCAPCVGQSNAPPNRISFSFMPRANWFRADKLTWQQILAGFLAATALTVLFTAKNSAPYSEHPIDWRYAYTGDLIGRFNYDALKTGFSGAFEVLPYLAAGAMIVWLLSKMRLAGVLPILVVGALMGRIAGAMIQPQYQTPFLTPPDSATLIGMIIAAGFGAAANAIGLRTNQDKIGQSGTHGI